jgi:hypothetical protein
MHFVRSLWPMIIGPDQNTYRNLNVNLALIISFSPGEKMVGGGASAGLIYFICFESAKGYLKFWYYPSMRERDLEFDWLQKQFEHGPYRLGGGGLQPSFYLNPKIDEKEEN